MENDGWDFQVISMPVCNNAISVVKLDGSPYPECDRHREWAIGQIRRLRPDLLILSNFTTIKYVAPSALTGTPLESWRDGLRRTLTLTRQHAARTIVISPPAGSGNLQSCRRRNSVPAECFGSVSKDWDRMRAAEQAAVAAAGAQYIDAIAWTCYAGICPAVVGGTAVFADGVHLTPVYASRLAPILGEAIREALARESSSR